MEITEDYPKYAMLASAKPDLPKFTSKLVPLKARRKFKAETLSPEHRNCARFKYGQHVFVVDSLGNMLDAGFKIRLPGGKSAQARIRFVSDKD